MLPSLVCDKLEKISNITWTIFATLNLVYKNMWPLSYWKGGLPLFSYDDYDETSIIE